MFIESSAILGGSPSRQSVEQFREARLVRITDGGFAIWLDPFWMLNPQIVVNLFSGARCKCEFRETRHLAW